MPQVQENIIDYLKREFRCFDEAPITDVDSLVLACLSYFRLPEEAKEARAWRGVPLHEIFRADWFDRMTEGLWDPEGLVSLLTAVVASPRFRGIHLSSYVSETSEEQEKQFAACALRLPTGDVYVSFRGTDNSLVGWKEDFNMAFETGVPSQRRAAQYLERVARRAKGRIYMGGHSKGGNLAVYAASHCKPATFDRIERVFSHDGPGFMGETLASSDFTERCFKVSKTVPESSLIGMMFEHQEDHAVVRSTSVGALQHDPFSWVVEGDSFAQADGLSKSAGYFDESINQWVCSMSREERAGFVNTLFSVLYAGGQETLAGLKGNLPETLPAMLSQLAGLDEEQRGYLLRAVAGLLRAFAPEVELPSLALRLAGVEATPPAGEQNEESGV